MPDPESGDPIAEFFTRIEAEHGSVHEALRARHVVPEFGSGGLLTPHVGHVHIAPIGSETWTKVFKHLEAMTLQSDMSFSIGPGESEDFNLALPKPLEIPDA